MGKYTDRVNETNTNNFGSLMIITSYRSVKDIDIYFPEYDYYALNREYHDFKKGNVKCPYEPRVHGVGYIGEGPYKILSKDKKQIIWNSMLQRCYQNDYSIKNRTYEDCFVCEEWHNFQNFAQWYEDNYYEISNQKMCLDKDILVKGNKIYSPDTCCFVPICINNLFTTRSRERGDLPIGVKFCSNLKTKPYVASITKNNKKETLGYFSTPEEAFECYKQIKEEYIKEVADEYSGQIPDDLYFALYSYEVDIND